MGTLLRILTHNEEWSFGDEYLPQTPQLKQTLPWKALLNFKLIANAVNRLIIKLFHQISLQALLQPFICQVYLSARLIVLLRQIGARKFISPYCRLMLSKLLH